MDALLLLAPTVDSIGYAGRGDYVMERRGQLAPPRRARGRAVRLCRVALLSPALFIGAPQGDFSLTTLFDRAGEAGRLQGLRLEGVWMHVGTPEAVAAGRSRHPRRRRIVVPLRRVGGCYTLAA